MRADHIRVFIKMADKFNCEIVVREQNPLSEQYIGRSGFKPKPIWCHAKTASNPNGPPALQGLVVNPFLFSNAFKPRKVRGAKKAWKDFDRKVLSQGLGFKLVDSEDHPRRCCVMFRGDYLYSDYDLKAITPLSEEKLPPSKMKPLVMKNHRAAPVDHATNFERKIGQCFYEHTGIQLVQHGAAVNEPGGNDRVEMCDVFRPYPPFHSRKHRTK